MSPGETVRAFVGLGSNLGQREDWIERAQAALEENGLRAPLRSALYETEPVGGPPQPAYLNAVVAGETTLGPEALLERCLEVEARLGRVRGERFGPRTIDLDVLLHGDSVRRGSGLTLPHPRLHERRFVLVPLAELAPDLRHPTLGSSIAELLARCRDRSAVAPFLPVARSA